MLKIRKIPFPDDSFDVIYNKVLEHLSNPDKFLTEAFRILKPGGIIISLVPDWNQIIKRILMILLIELLLLCLL